MKNYSIEFKWAALATLAALIWMFFEKYLGYHAENIRYNVLFSLLFNIVLVIIYILALKEKKKDFYQNNITWKQAFFTGLILCVMITFFFPLIQYITYFQVSPNYFKLLLDQIVIHNNMTMEEAMKNFSFDIYLRQGASSNLSLGVVVSAIISYYIQTKPGTEVVQEKERTIKPKYQGKRKIK